MRALHLLARWQLPGTVLVALISAIHPASAAIVDDVNAIRVHGCARSPGGLRALQVVAALSDAARSIANGASLEAALTASGYDAVQISSLHVAASGGESGTARLLREHYCAQINDPTLRDLGIAARGADTWIILAAPLATPRPEDAAAVSRSALALVNEARAHARRCGIKSFGATTPLKLSAALGSAALEHSRDMALRDYFDHQALDGSTPASRVLHAGYAWQVVGENIAAGVATPEEAIQGWLQSAPHCENLMDPRFLEMGIAYAINPKNTSVIFWTQLFAAPRRGGDSRGPR
jgi:uncharacterized protein YkwD